MAKGYKTGGRKPGTPNKATSPIKSAIRQHSEQYFTPEGDSPSQFEQDLALLSPAERIKSEIQLLEYHTAKIKAIDMDISLNANETTIEAQLIQLSKQD